MTRLLHVDFGSVLAVSLESFAEHRVQGLLMNFFRVEVRYVVRNNKFDTFNWVAYLCRFVKEDHHRAL